MLPNLKLVKPPITLTFEMHDGVFQILIHEPMELPAYCVLRDRVRRSRTPEALCDAMLSVVHPDAFTIRAIRKSA